MRAEPKRIETQYTKRNDPIRPEPTRRDPIRTAVVDATRDDPTRAEPNRSNRSEPNRTVPNRHEPNRTEPNRAAGSRMQAVPRIDSVTRKTPSGRTFTVSTRPGFRGVAPRDAAAIIGVLAEIAGTIGPPGEIPAVEWRKALVDRARPKASPIHHIFVWDDVEAGERYRLETQAGYYIRAFDFQYVDDRGVATPKTRWIPAIKLVRSNQRAPMAMPDVLSSQQAVDSLVDTALHEMQSWVRRYEALKHVAKLAPIFRAAERALATAKRKTKKKK